MRQHKNAIVVAAGLALVLSACGQNEAQAPADTAIAPEDTTAAPAAGANPAMTFFVTSRGSGRGGDLGGLAGADAHCQALADAQGAGGHAWRAYLSTTAADGAPAVNAHDRIGAGPWTNAKGEVVAASLAELHAEPNKISKATALTEAGATVGGGGDTPNVHDILTGSRPDGTAFPDKDLTCKNWTSSGEGMAQVGHHDSPSWNSAHESAGCSQESLTSTGGAGLFYCFASN